ncbi:MAG: alpha/beta hydrolase [Saprospiraceae bacterium]|nr:alpha/beta hydrolase [Saprospiraceae bacterium]HMW38468.1 alpha/beta hydrolase [Saprospiraceae bacterium]HMX87562.1 alpha/beta hydrolase [Saprospiraceae bacterium]HMZ39560.1 alpha/beta hydrolase [Saprospiraceae bacterium]HNA64213.1 alpha/beta hydrolase [Saprospiraceae bacterium]
MGKPKLLLLHGALGSMSEFEQLRGFLEPHFETLPFNFTGHGGRRIQPEGFTITSMAAELYSWIVEENIFRPIIFGYSMGGYVALKCEAQYPGLIGHIITLGTKFDWSTESTDKQISGLDIDSWRQKIPDYVSTLEKIHAPNHIDILADQTRHMMQHLSQNDYLKDSDLKNIQCRVSLLLGDLDRMVTQEETIQIQQCLTNSVLKILPETKHPLDKADPAMLVEIIYSETVRH